MVGALRLVMVMLRVFGSRFPCLWRERNARLCEDVDLPVVDLCRNVLNMLYVWALAHSLSRIMFTEFLHLCSFISSY